MVFLPFVILSILIACFAPPRRSEWFALILGTSSIGLILGYTTYFRTKESLYKKYYEEELALLRKREEK